MEFHAYVIDTIPCNASRHNFGNGVHYICFRKCTEMHRLVRIPAGCLLVIIVAIVSKTQHRGIIIGDPWIRYVIRYQRHYLVQWNTKLHSLRTKLLLFEIQIFYLQ